MKSVFAMNIAYGMLVESLLFAKQIHESTVIFHEACKRIEKPVKPLLRDRFESECTGNLGTPTGNRTPVAAVKGQCPNR